MSTEPVDTQPPIVVPPKGEVLPEGVKLQTDYKTDIDKFFDSPEPGKPAVGEEPKVVAPKEEPVKAEAPAAGSLSAKLAAKAQPTAPAKTDPVAASQVDDPVAKIEADMKAHDPKWRPAKGWDALKSTLKSEAEKRASLEKEIVEVRAKASQAIVVDGLTSAQVAELKAREKAASDRLMVLDLESHPQFRQQFVEPKQNEIAKATELLAAHGVKADIASLLAKPRSELGKAVSELVKDLPDFDRVEIAESVRKAYALDQQAKGALSQSKELAKNLQAKSVERQRDAFNRRWAPVSAALTEHIIELEVPTTATPEERADIESYNSEIKNLRTNAEKIALEPMSEEGIADAAMKAAAYDLHVNKMMPRIIKEYEEVVGLNRKLVSELAALKGRNPNHGIKATPSGGDDAAKSPENMPHAAAADHFFNKK